MNLMIYTMKRYSKLLYHESLQNSIQYIRFDNDAILPPIFNMEDPICNPRIPLLATCGIVLIVSVKSYVTHFKPDRPKAGFRSGRRPTGHSTGRRPVKIL